MDPITTAIVAALSVGAAAGLKGVLEKAIAALYEALQELMVKRFEVKTEIEAPSIEENRTEKFKSERLAVEMSLFNTENRIKYEAENPDLQKRCQELLEHAHSLIEKSTVEDAYRSLPHARALIKRADFLVTSTRVGRWYVLALLVVFLIILITLSIVTWNQWGEYEKVIVLGIPFPVLLWGAIGSLTAPLYKYLHSHKDCFLEEPIKWIFVRPIIGMVMGAAIYLIVKSGLLVFGNTKQIVNPELLWVLAFVGGFSESVSNRLLNIAETQIRGEQSSDTA